MGIFNPIQKQFIKRPDDAKNQIVYKWPDTNIRLHTQITVQPDEQVLFVKEGVVKGVLSEGMHDLDGANIPFIGGLLTAGTGGNYFVSEVYFVSIKEFVNQLFGGSIDNVTDPITKLAVGLRCYGEYAIKATDPQTLIINLTGTTNDFSMDSISTWVGSQLLKTVRETVTSHIVSDEAQMQWQILGIASHTNQLEQDVIAPTNEILKSYGLIITRLGNITVSIKDEDIQTLKQLMRDTAYSHNMAAADAALKLGAAKGFEEGNENPGLFAAGLGFGYGATQSAVQSTMQNQMACPSCTAQNNVNAKFCSNCGATLHP